MRGIFAILSLCLALTVSARAQQNDGVTEFYAGHASLQQGDADAAIAHFSKALQIGKLEPTQVAYVHYYRAIAYQRLDRHQDAIDGYTQALSFNVLPKRVQAALYYNRAIALDHLANFDRAIKDYSAAIALKPDYAEAYMNRGNAYRKLGDNDQALRDYAASASYGNPIKHLPYYGQGLIYEAKGDKENAYKAFQTAMMLAPDFEPARLKVEGYQAAGMSGIGTSSAMAKSAIPQQTPQQMAAETPPLGIGMTGATAYATSASPPLAAPPPTGTSGAVPVASTMPSNISPTVSATGKPAAPVNSPAAGAASSSPAPSAPAAAMAHTTPGPAATTAPQKIASIESPAVTGPAIAPKPASGPSISAAAPPPTGSHAAVGSAVAEPTPAFPAPGPSAAGGGPAVAAAVPGAASAPAMSGATGATPPQMATAEPPGAISGGAYLIQIAAFKDEPTAQAEAAGFKAKGGGSLADVQQIIQRADLGAKGVYYRVQYGPFASKGAAAARCNDLKGKGLTCIVVSGGKG